MQTGNIAARDKLTGRLWFQRTGDAFVDLGNVLLVKQNLDNGVVEQITWSKGRGQVTHEEPGQVKPKWSLKLDERTGEALRLLNLATSQTIHSPVFLDDPESVTTLVSGVELSGPRQMLYLEITHDGGDYNFNLRDAEDQTVATGEYEGTQEIEGEEITLVEANDSGIAGTFVFTTDGQYEIAIFEFRPCQRYASISEAFVRGAVKIVLQDQHNIGSQNAVVGQEYDVTGVEAGDVFLLGWRRISNFVYTSETGEEGTDFEVNYETGEVTILTDAFEGEHLHFTCAFDAPAMKFDHAPKHELSFSAELRVTDRGDMTGEKFNEFELELLATGTVDILSRE